MQAVTFEKRRGQLETYFDQTAAAAWALLTSDQNLGRIRASVRAGRERMRGTLLACLPDDLHGRRLLDAGSGTGALAIIAAERGAAVTAVDLSQTLTGLARDRAAQRGIDFVVGDMTDPALGRFDHVMAMDSLIHYTAADVVRVLACYAARTDRSIVFTFVPLSPLLAAQRAVGRLFPRSNRSPAVEPVTERALRRRLAAEPALAGWRVARTTRVSSGFYTSQAMELVRA